MKPIVIAGNGPSFLEIDYSRLPKDFDVYRCNQFYLENRYFLGKEIKGVFFNPEVFKEQYFTLHHLIEKEEYEIEDVYCNWFPGENRMHWNQEVVEFLNIFPYTKIPYLIWEKVPRFVIKNQFFKTFYNQWMTSGIVMLVTAIAQGYKEIYLTGIDFYMGGGADYAFDVTDKKIAQLLPSLKDKNYQPPVHHRKVDSAFIRMALKEKDLKLYCLSPTSAIAEILPLAPIQRERDDFSILPKPQGYICDFVDLPNRRQGKTRIEKIKQILAREGFDSSLKKNIFFIFVRDFLLVLRAFFVLIRHIRK